MDTEIIEHFASLVEEFGTSDIYYTFDTVDLLPPRYKDEANRLEKSYQVFDSWFDSSLSWNYALREATSSPMTEQSAEIAAQLATSPSAGQIEADQ